MPDQSILAWFTSRSLRLIGLFLVFASAGLLIFLVLLDIIAGISSPYIGIITYLVLPLFLITGLLLVPLDAWLARRRAAAGLPEYPEIDLKDPGTRRIISFFLISGSLILIILTVVTYKAVEFMDTDTFCGRVCHRVMIPEHTAFIRSSHASVGCVSCHIGPGAPWFVRAKLSGVPQVYHYLTNTYEKPIPTPVEALRPSRDTCEDCHWPKEFYGNTLRTAISYLEDEKNTQQVQTQILKVGSGGVPGTGIHSHMAVDMYYLPANKERSEIAWVGVKRKGGGYTEFANPAHKEMAESADRTRRSRLMDCIDCHNRAAHDFLPFDKLLDVSITRREIPRDLPFIKREALRAAGEPKDSTTAREQQAAIKRINNIEAFYKREYPDLYARRTDEIRRVVSEIKRVYMSTVFPIMKVGPDTYPNWRTHTGCFRCHGTLMPVNGEEPLSQDCNLCHTMLAQETSSQPTL